MNPPVAPSPLGAVLRSSLWPVARRGVIFLTVWLAINVVIAQFLVVVGGERFQSFWGNMVFGVCFGLSCGACYRVAGLFVPRGPRRLIAMLIALLVGVPLGGTVALWVVGYRGPFFLPATVWVPGVFFGTLSVLFIWMGMGIRHLRDEVQARELARVEAEKRGVEAQLKMLQAQIEPHFLFNSLANVSALIAIDPPRAGHLLDALIQYLRSSLRRTRAEGGTLGDEVDLLASYLAVLKIRMGARLDYSIEVAETLRGLPFPPMLAQPLVENAIAHGLEPRIEGGVVRVSAERAEGGLRVVVSDSGLGLRGTTRDGVGLSNIRARLEALYGSAGRLTLGPTPGGGVTATLEIPA